MLKVASKWIPKKSVMHHSQPMQFTKHLQPAEPVVEMYDKTTIHQMARPADQAGQEAADFLLPLLSNGVHHYIDNVHTDLRIIKIDGIILPLTLNNAEYDNSYVCSPHSYYFTFSEESMQLIKNKLLRTTMQGLFGILSKWCRSLSLNKVIIVNNWLLSTSLYPPLTHSQIEAITTFLKRQFPSHAIVFRSVDEGTNPLLYQSLKTINYSFIAAKQMFYTDTTDVHPFESRLYKSDLKLLHTSGYQIIPAEELHESDIPRLLKLYQSVYLDKYSHRNLQIIPNPHFLKLALTHPTLRLMAIKKDGMIDGVAGYICQKGIMTCPFFGYDKTKPHEIGLYRILCTVLMEEARKRNAILHQGSGASTYKKIRKAKDSIEYHAVYSQHLSTPRKLPWMMLKLVFNSIGVHYMKKY